MSQRAQHARRRATQQMRLRPVWILYRRLTRLDGPYPAQNPPRVQGLLAVNGAHNAGGSTLAIRATRLQGRVVAGDKLALGDVVYTVTGTATDNGAHVITASITPVLAANAADGAVLLPQWVAEKRIPCRQQDFGLRMVDGEKIVAGDQRITVAAQDLDADPQAEDQVVLIGDGGRVLTVVNRFPARVDGVPITWDLQVRT